LNDVFACICILLSVHCTCVAVGCASSFVNAHVPGLAEPRVCDAWFYQS